MGDEGTFRARFLAEWKAREARSGGKLSVARVAAETGAPPNVIRELRRREGSTKVETAKQIAHAWGFSVDDGRDLTMPAAINELVAIALDIPEELRTRLLEEARLYRDVAAAAGAQKSTDETTIPDPDSSQ